MDHLLNLSRAAKMAGVSRQQIQAHIQGGGLETFEGSVRMSALSRVYPDIGSEVDAIFERMSRIQDNALFKLNPEEIPDERLLANQVHRLQVELGDAYAEIESYQRMVLELKDRLVIMQEGCDRKEKQILQALLGWISAQMKQRA